MTSLLAELWEQMQTCSADEAAGRICEKRGVRPRAGTGWRFFLPLPAGGRVLEIGAGFGDDTLALCSDGASVIGLVPSEINRKVLEHRLRERGVENATVVVHGDLARLPLPDASVDAVAFEDAAAPGFSLTEQQLPALATEIDRVLAADGAVFVGVKNRYRSLPGAKRLLPLARRESLNRLAKRDGKPRPKLRRESIERALRERGFAEPEVFAPIPHEQSPGAVASLKQPEPLRYCFNDFLRRNALTGASVAVANAAAATGVLQRLLPYYYLIFRRA